MSWVLFITWYSHSYLNLYDILVVFGMGSQSYSIAVFHHDVHIFETCVTGLGPVRFCDVEKQV